MNTQYFKAETETLEPQLKERQLPLEDTGKKDLMLEQIKKLYLEMKKLNQRLQKCLQESNLESHQ